MGSDSRMAVPMPGNCDLREAGGTGARGKLLKLLREEKSGTSSPGPESAAEYSIITSWLESRSRSGLDSSSASARSSFL